MGTDKHAGPAQCRFGKGKLNALSKCIFEPCIRKTRWHVEFGIVFTHAYYLTHDLKMQQGSTPPQFVRLAMAFLQKKDCL